MIRIAILDDYQNVVAGDGRLVAARRVRREVTVFDDHLTGLDEVVERLLPFGSSSASTATSSAAAAVGHRAAAPVEADRINRPS